MSGQNLMYMAGGEYPDGSASQAFMRYDPVLDIWQEMASLRTPRSELGKALKPITGLSINSEAEFASQTMNKNVHNFNKFVHTFGLNNSSLFSSERLL